MGKLKALTLAGAATAFSGAALAADLPPPPIPAEPAPYAAPAAIEFSGWYLRGDIGIGLNERPKFKTTPDPLLGTLSGLPVTSYDFHNSEISASGTIGAGVGYQFNNWFRFDVTGEYRGVGGRLSAVDQLNAAGTFNGTSGGIVPVGNYPATASLRNFYSGHVSSLVFLANGYVDLGTWNGITPYIGAGAGFAHNMVRGLNDTGFLYTNVDYTAGGGGVVTQGSPTGGFFSAGNKTNFAWALMAGLGYNVSPNLKLELGYRYLNLGSFKSGRANCFNADGSFTSCLSVLSTQKTASHDFRIGMRWLLGDAAPTPVHYEAPAPYPEPLVRKF